MYIINIALLIGTKLQRNKKRNVRKGRSCPKKTHGKSRKHKKRKKKKKKNRVLWEMTLG